LRTEEGIRSFGMGTGPHHFQYLYGALQTLCSAGKPGKPKGVRTPLIGCLPPSSMMFYCSDFLDNEGDLASFGPLRRAMRRYDFIPIVIQDGLEYSFPRLSRGSFIPFTNPETGAKEENWISPTAALAIRAAHEARFTELSAALNARGLRPLHL